jgi:hypothetical protein
MMMRIDKGVNRNELSTQPSEKLQALEKRTTCLDFCQSQDVVFRQA